ncbi:MAG TPA: hypothetical protein VNS55_06620 [Nocardioides sp.]|nr:hypothetical protein [Nocardioides sp.]
MIRAIGARKLVTGGVVGLAVLTAGCNATTVVGAEGPQPGVAARVGDTTLSIDDADLLTDTVCDAQAQNPQAQPTTRVLAEQGIIGQWVTAEAAMQIVDDKGIDVDVQPFDRSQIPGWDDLSEDEQEVVGEYADGLSFLNAAGPKLDQGDESQNGLDLSGVDISINPRYDISLQDHRLEASSNDLSVAVSDESAAGAADQPTTEQLMALPDSQLCGPRPQASSPQSPGLPVPQG